ncbi:MAG: cysteine--tRNA ligase [Clostridia bacterium]|nr:cysteine--tRNA ligase [Clostridia bacterium]
MKIYNTLTRRKEDFVPLQGNKVNMYACGITVSGEAHIGHAYQALVYDIVRNYLIYLGYDVTYTRNYTDVDDKIIAKSHETGIPADKYAAQMIKNIDAVMSRFGVGEPDKWMKATQNIGNIIKFIKQLIEKGHAYPTPDGSVYFSVESFKGYGALSNRRIEDMLDGVRVSNDESKVAPLDFALWKAAKEGEIAWASPWGMGRPGWHIECSAMNKAAFGDQIDIHGGGRDLIFPHHENEIAQTEALTGKRFVKYWMHNGLIKVNGQKMSKSLGNSLLLSDLLDKYSAEAIKFALLETSYRNDINVTDNMFPDAEKHMTDFYTVINAVEESTLSPVDGFETGVKAGFEGAMSDDFNTALALANLYGYIKTAKAYLNKGDGRAVNFVEDVKKYYAVLELFKTPSKEYLSRFTKDEDNKEIMLLADQMQKARLNKDYQTADMIRAKIGEMGYQVMISKEGVTVKKI